HALLAEEPVHERGLAGIGPADKRQPNTIIWLCTEAHRRCECGYGGDDVLEHERHPVTALCRYGPGVTQAQSVEFRRCFQACQTLTFVDGNDQRLFETP